MIKKQNSSFNLTTSRIEMFSDAVFAIVITLLILELKVPTVASEMLSTKILELWPNYLSYFISFIIIGVYWVGHYNMFHYIKKADRNFLWINILFLMVIAFIPFPTAILGQYPLERISIIFYGLTLIIAGLTLYSLWSYATYKNRLLGDNVPLNLVSNVKKIILKAPVAYIIAIALSFVDARLGLVIYLVVPLIYIFPGSVDKMLNVHT